MKEYTFNYSFSPIPQFMRKGKQVMIVLKNNEGNYILGTKHIYPKGIYRFVGGGVNKDEEFLSATIRELKEELGIEVTKQELTPLAKFIVEVIDNQKKVHFETMLYHLSVCNRKLTPSDDLDGLIELTKDEVVELTERYKNLSTDLINIGGNKKGSFRWSDYGIFMSEIHRIGKKLA